MCAIILNYEKIWRNIIEVTWLSPVKVLELKFVPYWYLQFEKYTNFDFRSITSELRDLALAMLESEADNVLSRLFKKTHYALRPEIDF